MEEILHHQKDVWNPINNGISSIYQLAQDFATIHSMSRLGTQRIGELPFGFD